LSTSPDITTQPDPPANGGARSLVSRLSLTNPWGLRPKLAVICIILVLIAEILVFIPSAANYRLNWLSERVERAQTASLAVEAAPDFEVTEELAGELLANAEVLFVALKRNGERQLILMGETNGFPVITHDLREETYLQSITAALLTLFQSRQRNLRILAEPRLEGGEFIEVLMPAAPLHDAMISFFQRILVLSIIIALVVASGLYLVLDRLLVRPIRRLVRGMSQFRVHPERVELDSAHSGRMDELGVAETELAMLRQQVRSALHERERLAGLGEAVAKINHDLRNVLTSAHLVSDRLRHHSDPAVSARAERLVRSIDRGVRLAEDVLRYGRAEEGAGDPQIVRLRPLLEDAFQDASAASEQPTGLDLDIDPDLTAFADPDHIHRISLNLMRNAVQAMAAGSEERGRPGVLQVSARKDGDSICVIIRDEAGGIPENVRERLFRPFEARKSKGGSGLGLAIARQLARANSGEVTLGTTGPKGTTFELRLPARHQSAVS
jgi:signal transduction histidine kinase